MERFAWRQAPPTLFQFAVSRSSRFKFQFIAVIIGFFAHGVLKKV
jgi:hypothetical protein